MLGCDEVGVYGLDTVARPRFAAKLIASGENGGGACAGRGEAGADDAS